MSSLDPWHGCTRVKVRRQRRASKDMTTYEPQTLLCFSLALLLICNRAVLTKPVTLFETYSIRFTPSDISVSASIPFSLSYSQTTSISFILLQYFIESNLYFGLVIYWCSTMLELDIIIVGAGISGLASAIALSRAGHNVQVSAAGSQIGLNR